MEGCTANRTVMYAVRPSADSGPTFGVPGGGLAGGAPGGGSGFCAESTSGSLPRAVTAPSIRLRNPVSGPAVSCRTTWLL